MPNNFNIALLLVYGLLAAIGFFVVAPVLLNTISLFTVQKKFAATMVQEGIITQKAVDGMEKTKQFGSIITTTIVTVIFVFLMSRQGAVGFGCGLVPFVVGLIKYRAILSLTNVTARNFFNTYKNFVDVEKFQNYMKKTFGKESLTNAPKKR